MNGRKFGIGVLAVVVTVGLAVRFAEAAEKIQYRLKLQKAQRYYIRMITEGSTSYTIMGREQPMEEVVSFGYDFDVNEIDNDGNASVRCTFDWIKLRQKGPRGEVVYDSTQLFSPAAPAAKQFSQLLGGSFQIKTTPLGNIVQVKGLKRMFANIEKNLTRRQRQGPMLKGLKAQFTEKTIKQIFENHLAIYPKSAVGVGDSWRKTVVAPRGYPVIAENLWTLKERKNGIAIIENNATIKPDPNAKPTVRGDTKTSYKFEGKQNGLIEVIESTGLIRESKLNLELTGEMKVETTGKETPERLIPVKIQNIVTFQMTERKKEEDQEKAVVQ
jgi:hypothetical protein